MTRAEERLATARAELDAIRADLITYLQTTLGSSLGPDQARVLLEKAQGWSPRGARRLADHFAANPTALSAPSPHCPAPLPRLLRLLAAAGYAVTVLGCVRCGRTDRRLDRLAEDGRCCGLCLDSEGRRCARCGLTGRITARREDGPICHSCYCREPGFLKECASRGQQRAARARRREDGAPLCWACAPNSQQHCAQCGLLATVIARTDAGPVCRRCYIAPPRQCGICGQFATLRHRGGDGRPASCTRCYRNLGQCAVCGRLRAGSKLGGGAFHCNSCRPHRPSLCALCRKSREVGAIWPLGIVCHTCYQRRELNPTPCASCTTTRVLIGRDNQGRDICGPCCGTDTTYDCRRCGQPGMLHSEGACARCVAHDRVHDLLSDDDGTLAQQLRPLAEALTAAQPYSTLSWLATSPAATLLAGLVTQHDGITHDLLDELPQTSSIRYIRELLTTTAILKPRPEPLHQLQLWLSRTLADLPAPQRGVIAPFAEWEIMRDARRRVARGRYSNDAAGTDRRDIRAAITFLDWIDIRDTTLKHLTQPLLDLWLDANPNAHRHTSAFLRWARAHRITAPLDFPTRRNSPPARFISNDELRDQLRRCLNDTSLPLEVRIVGALVRLYAIPVTRILDLTIHSFHRVTGNSYLTLGAHQVLLPPKLALLIEEQIARPRRFSTAADVADAKPVYLIPGHPPSRARSRSAMSAAMARYGLPSAIAHNTAMITAVTELPPIVVSDLFGISPNTANAWARLAQASWTDYLDTQTSSASME